MLGLGTVKQKDIRSTRKFFAGATDNLGGTSKKGGEIMKLIKMLPFDSVMDQDTTDCALWTDNENLCEYQTDLKAGICDTSGMFYGTSDEREPKFCARHFYQLVVSGDGITNYGLNR